jgi:SAM-dependent methyltransferase
VGVSWKRAVRWALYVLAAEHVLEALMARRRREQLVELPAAGPHAADGPAPDVEQIDVLALPGATVDQGTMEGVAREMQHSGADVVDLVPGDLPVERALRLLRWVDPERIHDDPLYAPGGAHEAVAVRRSLAEKLGLAGGESVERGTLRRRTIRAERYAPTSTVLRVAPKLRAMPATAVDRWRELQEAMAFTEPNFSLAPAVLSIELGHLVVLTAGVALAPWAGLVALATWSAQPLVAFGGSTTASGRAGLVPPDLVRSSLLRLPLGMIDTLGTAVGGLRAAQSRQADKPAAPPTAVAPTVRKAEELFDPPLSACPWCGSESLVGRLDTTDLLQLKPGKFHLDECRDCGHIFQNPALSLDGLNYYYDQFYDGANEEMAEATFATMPGSYRGRIEAVAQFTEPRAWLDVGAGHGHFSLMARQRWPEARFDGLDLSESVAEAERRGWVDTAYRGLFPEVAEALPRSYDVVSMHHYLEHTREPRRELAAAVKVLEPGGYLMVEVPDPASPWSRRLGRYWVCWFQPQHQHFVTCHNLIAALQDSGLEVVSVERGPATTGGDLSFACLLALQERAPGAGLPWLPRPTPVQRVKRLAMLAVGGPLFGVLLMVDYMRDSRLRGPAKSKPSNAFRIVARRP